jgi:DNA-binding CsgD family transcriptional regulator
VFVVGSTNDYTNTNNSFLTSLALQGGPPAAADLAGGVDGFLVETLVTPGTTPADIVLVNGTFHATAASDGVEHPRAWIRTVFAKAVWQYRRRPARLDFDEDSHPSVTEAPTMDLDALCAALQTRVPDVRAMLTDAEARVFDLVLAGRTIAACAGELSMSRWAVRVRFRRVCDKLGGIFFADSFPPPLG